MPHCGLQMPNCVRTAGWCLPPSPVWSGAGCKLGLRVGAPTTSRVPSCRPSPPDTTILLAQLGAEKVAWAGKTLITRDHRCMGRTRPDVLSDPDATMGRHAGRHPPATRRSGPRRAAHAPRRAARTALPPGFVDTFEQGHSGGATASRSVANSTGVSRPRRSGLLDFLETQRVLSVQDN